jgi:hypothetical protein
MPSAPRRRHHYRPTSFVRLSRHCSSAAERLIRNQQVGGSNPSSGWTFKRQGHPGQLWFKSPLASSADARAAATDPI